MSSLGFGTGYLRRQWTEGSIVEAIVAADSDRERIAEIGNRNAELIASSYRQSTYGDALTRIYADLAQGEGHTSSVPAEASAPRNGA